MARGYWVAAVLSLAAAVGWGFVLDRYSQGVALSAEVLVIEALFVVLFVVAVAAAVALDGRRAVRGRLCDVERYVRRREREAKVRHSMMAVCAGAVLALTIVACTPAPVSHGENIDAAAAESLEQIIQNI